MEYFTPLEGRFSRVTHSSATVFQPFHSHVLIPIPSVSPWPGSNHFVLLQLPKIFVLVRVQPGYGGGGSPSEPPGTAERSVLRTRYAVPCAIGNRCALWHHKRYHVNSKGPLVTMTRDFSIYHDSGFFYRRGRSGPRLRSEGASTYRCFAPEGASTYRCEAPATPFVLSIAEQLRS